MKNTLRTFAAVEITRPIRAHAVELIAALAGIGELKTGDYVVHERFGIECLIPDEEKRGKINAIIFEELCAGKFLDASRGFVIDAAHELSGRGAQAIVLACTELPLIVGQEDLDVPRFDTMTAHVEEGLDFLTG